MKVKVIKLLEETEGDNLCNLDLGKGFLDRKQNQ